MEFDLDQKRVSLSAGEFSEFSVGPRSSDGGQSGLWRAQLGTYWHQQLRKTAQVENPATTFEVTIEGDLLHRGWRVQIAGRIDQEVPSPTPLLREIKTVTRLLPASEEELRREYPAYFLQLSAYRALRGIVSGTTLPAELLFVEAGSGLAQPVPLGPADDAAFDAQLDRLVTFLNLRLAAKARLSQLQFRSPFETLRPGQEDTMERLRSALDKHRIVAFEAPTGFGKTGMLLHAALERLRDGKCERLVYLTGKATGQLQVTHTLRAMTGGTAAANGSREAAIASWVVRPKQEHCVNTAFRCTAEACRFLADIETRWPGSGLFRFCEAPEEARDIASLRSAGASACVCPYEITRTALAFNEVWVGDFNYVFSPSARSLFSNQPGWEPSRTLVIIDEAHNLPSRVADNYSERFDAGAAQEVVRELRRIRAAGKVVRAWENWLHFLDHVAPVESLSLADEEDCIHLLDTIRTSLQENALDTASLSPEVLETLWKVPAFLQARDEHSLPRLWWSATPGELRADCLDAAPAIGATLKTFATVLLASATFPPGKDLSAVCGLADSPVEPVASLKPEKFGSLTKRETKKVWKSVVSGADLLLASNVRDAESLHLLPALAPWREGAYDIAFDSRVDTRYAQRADHLPTTVATLLDLVRLAPRDFPCAVAFFPSYAYAQLAHDAFKQSAPDLSAVLQPRASELSSAEQWIADALQRHRLLFLVLGSSLAESIDMLGGRVAHALVAGPALPEVNAIQRARLREGPPGETKEEAFRRVYQLSGMQRVNQALGRLVRAPGQRTRVVLHCRRFSEKTYRELLASEYRNGTLLTTEHDWTHWLTGQDPHDGS